MNRSEIDRHAKIIESRRAALKWLADIGSKFTGKKDDAEASFDVCLLVGGSVDGSTPAARLIEAYARSYLPEIVKASIECCHNDIAMSRDAIERELATLDAPS